MRKILKIAVLIIGFFFFCLFPQKTYASILFQDNFDNGSSSQWLVSGSPGWNVSGGRYGIFLSPGLSNSLPKDSLWNYSWTSIIYDVDLIGKNGVDKNILLKFNNTSNFVEIHANDHGIFLDKASTQGGGGIFASSSTLLQNGITYHFRTEINNDKIKVFLNNSLIFDVKETTPLIQNWKIGLRAGTGSTPITEVYFDNIVVQSLDESLEPIVILPGMGASWNHQAMLFGLPQLQSQWFMTPGITVYDSLISAFKNLGYVTSGPNQNLFIFNYDWTKPVSQIADDLKNYINNTVKPLAGTTINLVGHSLGGLTARTYVQNNPSAPVSHLITLGAPEKGVVKVYYLWEGGDLTKSGLGGVDNLAAGLLLHLRSPGFSTTAKALQTVIPSFKDILPTFNYLKSNGQIKQISQMSQKNTWLSNLNIAPPANLLTVLNSFVGNQVNSTLSFLNVSPPDWLNQILGLYPDGKPLSEEKSNGDDTILVNSGQIANATVTSFDDLSHGDLVQNKVAIQKVLEALGLVPQTIPDQPTQNFQHSLVFEVSPNVKVSVTNNQGQNVATGDGQLMLVPDATTGNYQVSVTGQSSGDYHLYSGQVSDNNSLWTTTGGTTISNQTDNYQLNFDPQNLQPITDTDGIKAQKTARTLLNDLKTSVNNETTLSSAVKRTSLTQINDLIRLLDKNDFENNILGLYRLRASFNSQNLKNKIQEIINNLEISYIKKSSGSYNAAKLAKEITSAQTLFNQQDAKLKSLAVAKRKPEFAALYLLDQEKLNQAKAAVSYEAHIKALGSQYLSQEALKFYK